MTCRDWLQANGYKDLALLIEKAMEKIAARGSKQRRNWWDILSGSVDGRPCVREGIEFPVLRIAQIRQGKPISKNAISRNSSEEPPEIVTTHRWPEEEKPLTGAQHLMNHRSDSETDVQKRRRAS
jgi:hypothetical protein